MNMNLEILDLAQGMASYASKRQMVISENIANADTPGYKARDLRPFSESYAQDFRLKTSRPQHFAAGFPSTALTAIAETNAEAAPNGNTVSLEQEMTKAAELRNQYDMALGIYRKSLDILRLSLGK